MTALAKVPSNNAEIINAVYAVYDTGFSRHIQRQFLSRPVWLLVTAGTFSITSVT